MNISFSQDQDSKEEERNRAVERNMGSREKLDFFSYLVFIHNHKLNSAIQLDLKGNEENMEPKELQ